MGIVRPRVGADVLPREARHAIRRAVAPVPGLDPATIEDVIAGCAMPEAEQGLNA